MALFEGYERRIDKINEVLNSYGISSIEEAKNQEVTSVEAYEAVLADFKYLLDEVKGVKAAADESGDYLTSTKMDDYIEFFSKAIWMVGQEVR